MLSVKMIAVYMLIFVASSRTTPNQMTHTINFSADRLTFEKSEGYDVIGFPEGSFLDEVGSPMLPLVTIHLIIPVDKDVKEVKANVINTHPLPGTYNVYPAQPPIPTKDRITLLKFVEPNQKIYGSNQVFPIEVVRVIHTGFFDGANRIVSLEVCPFRYRPLSKTLDLISSMELQLELSATDGTPLYRRNRSKSAQRLYNAFLGSLVENPADISIYGQSPAITRIEEYHSQYIIITNEELAPAFQPLCDWRRYQGITAEITLISNIENAYDGVDTQEKIRNFLIDEYSYGALDFVLLGGDENVVPIRYAYPSNTDTTKALKKQQVCDLYYSDLTGDWEVDGDSIWGEPLHDDPDIYPEVYVGRVPADTPEEVENFIGKLLIYEKNPGDGIFDYLTKALWIAADQMCGYPREQAQIFPPYFIVDTSSCIEKPSGYDPYPTRPYGYDVINTMNQGWQFISVLCHGNPDNYKCLSGDTIASYVWGDREGPPIQWHSGAITDLWPTSCFTITYSISCDNAWLDLETFPWTRRDKCFGEVGILLPWKSDVAYLGNSRYGWIHSSPPIQKDFYRHIFQPDSSDSAGGLLRVGVLEINSKLDHAGTRDILYGHNLWGDPAMRVWSRQPSYFNISTIGRVRIGPASITVRTGVPYSIVCMRWSSQGFYEIEEADQSGQVIFETDFTDDIYSAEDTLSFVVTHQNFIPYVAKIPIYDDNTLVIHDIELCPPPYPLTWGYPWEGGTMKYRAKIYNGTGFEIPARFWQMTHTFYQESECGLPTEPPVLEETTLGDRDFLPEEERFITFALTPLPCGSRFFNNHVGIITIGTSIQETDSWCMPFVIHRGNVCNNEYAVTRPDWSLTRLYQLLITEISNE